MARCPLGQPREGRRSRLSSLNTKAADFPPKGFHCAFDRLRCDTGNDSHRLLSDDTPPPLLLVLRVHVERIGVRCRMVYFKPTFFAVQEFFEDYSDYVWQSGATTAKRSSKCVDNYATVAKGFRMCGQLLISCRNQTVYCLSLFAS